MGIFSKKTKKVAEKKPAEAAAVSASVEPKILHPTSARRVLIAPHASEKASRLEQGGTYVFLVRDDANKTLVKEEVERRYKVKVKRVNIVRNHDAFRFFRGRWHEGEVGKKAHVTLVSGAKIDIK
ncbi:MAG: 50S ribosomal protein L23 [Candidatus Brennerbacteria bacterium]